MLRAEVAFVADADESSPYQEFLSNQWQQSQEATPPVMPACMLAPQTSFSSPQTLCRRNSQGRTRPSDPFNQQLSCSHPPNSSSCHLELSTATSMMMKQQRANDALQDKP
jgi:hypothetical protein